MASSLDNRLVDIHKVRLLEAMARRRRSIVMWIMKNVLHKLFVPSNRAVRIIVGLMLVSLLVIQVTQSVATHEPPRPVVVTQPVEGIAIETRKPEQLAKLIELAKTDHLALLEWSKAEFEKRGLKPYTTTFVKQEKIRGKLGDEQHIDVKFRPRPFSVAMHWVKNPPIGDTVLYIEGKNKDEAGRSQMIVRPTNRLFQKLVGSVKKLPDGPDAMRNTLRPCTAFGFQNSIQSLIDVYAIARQRNECSEKFEGIGEVDGRQCIVLARYLPQREDYPAGKTLVFIDVETLLPLRVVGYDWDDSLLCNYEFRDIDLFADLTADDFTPKANDISVR